MFEYPLINYLPQLILASVWFFPGLVLGIIYGWRAHITYLQAQAGELQKEPGAIIDVASVNATPTAEEEHKPGEFFW